MSQKIWLRDAKEKNKTKTRRIVPIAENKFVIVLIGTDTGQVWENFDCRVGFGWRLHVEGEQF